MLFFLVLFLHRLPLRYLLLLPLHLFLLPLSHIHLYLFLICFSFVLSFFLSIFFIFFLSFFLFFSFFFLSFFLFFLFLSFLLSIFSFPFFPSFYFLFFFTSFLAVFFFFLLLCFLYILRRNPSIYFSKSFIPLSLPLSSLIPSFPLSHLPSLPLPSCLLLHSYVPPKNTFSLFPLFWTRLDPLGRAGNALGSLMFCDTLTHSPYCPHALGSPLATALNQ